MKGKDKGETEEPRPLTEKEEWFCREYVCDENGTKAYLRVFKCSYDSAKANAYRLLTNDCIRQRIDELREERNKRLEISADRVLRELSKLAFYDPRGFFDEDGRLKPVGEIDPDQAAVIGGIETMHKVVGEESDGITVLTKIKLPDKKGALELIGRNLKMWKDVGSGDNPMVGEITRVELVALDDGTD